MDVDKPLEIAIGAEVTSGVMAEGGGGLAGRPDCAWAGDLFVALGEVGDVDKAAENLDRPCIASPSANGAGGDADTK